MRTLIVTAFVSLDGVMEAPGGEPNYRNTGWTFKDIEHVDESYEIKGREQQEAGAMMMGRVSYEAFAPIWPDLDYFTTYNALPKYVVSTTLQEADLVTNWGETHILRSADDVAALKETGGGPIIIHGSARLGASLADAGLVDRYHLLLFPTLLGAGKRLFSSTDKDKQMLRVVEQRVLLERPPEAGLRRRQVTPPGGPSSHTCLSPEALADRGPTPPACRRQRGLLLDPVSEVVELFGGRPDARWQGVDPAGEACCGCSTGAHQGGRVQAEQPLRHATAASRSSGVTTDKTAARASRLRTAASQLLTGTFAPR